MLRWVVAVLLLSNAAYYAWSQGILQSWGLAAQSAAEPQRMAQQLHPELLQLLTRATPPSAAASSPPDSPDSPTPLNTSSAASVPQEAASAPEPAASAAMDAPVSAPPVAVPASARASVAAPSLPVPAPTSEPTQCLQAGLFDEAQARGLRQAIAAHLPEGSATLEEGTMAARWMVYMGRFSDAQALERKRVELRGMGIAYDRPGATLEHGLSLGRFASEERAEVALKDLARQGIRTARVIQERSDSTVYTLRLPAVTATQEPLLKKLRPALAGKPLRPCQ